jgi:uncharacterized repeat protein (TIGR01451 family)
MSTPSVYKIRQRANLTRRFFRPVVRSTPFLILLFVLLVTSLYSGSSASTLRAKSGSRQPKAVARGTEKLIKGKDSRAQAAILPGFVTGLFMVPQQAPDPDTITTYAADCTTPKSDFHFGDVVCAKVDAGIPLSVIPRRFAWVDPYNKVLQRTTVTTLPQTDSFTIPARDLTDDNRGVWRVTIINTRSSVRVSTDINVSDAAAPAANVLAYDNVNTDTADVAAGSNIEFAVWVSNQGPDTATNVEIVDSVNGGATFVSSVQDSGPTLTCAPSAGGTTCTIASLAVGDSARIRVIYQVNGGASVGTIIANTATISSDKTDQFPDNNTAVAQLIVTDNTPGSSCALLCPGNIFKPADTTENGQNGAHVSFGTGETSGECGTITSSPASGSFFPVGTTTVTQSSSSGESCTFNVTVTEGDAPPTISCPAPVNKDAGNDCSVELTAADLGTPTTTGTGVTVDAERNDGQPLDAPYPVGTTTIIWTATDEQSRHASCNQTVTVTGTDVEAPTIVAPANITDTTGATGAACGKIIGESELGKADVADNCSSDANITIIRTGVPAGNFFPVGTTTITYKAKDSAGNISAPVTQTVTVTDNTPPAIRAPADASYVCPSDVPAGNPSQATGDDENLPNGGPIFDSCGGAVTVTVSDSTTGAGSASSPMVITRTFTATDERGNAGHAVQTITVIDNVAPTITLNGASSMTVECHTSFTDPGASSSDNCSGAGVTVSGAVDVNTPGTYTLSYKAVDAAGNESPSVTRNVTVVDTIPPTIALNGASPMTVECHTTFTDPGATASDSCAGDLTSSITVTGSVDANTVGTYTLTYSVNDGQGHSASINRTVNVVDTTAPTINLNGQNITFWPANHSYKTVNVTDLVASVTDSCDTTIALSNVVISKVTSDEVENGTGDGNTLNDIVLAGNCKSVQLRAERDGGGNGRVYTITFKVTDASGNVGTTTAQVKVPKSSGSAAVDSGPHYTVNGNCP